MKYLAQEHNTVRHVLQTPLRLQLLNLQSEAVTLRRLHLQVARGFEHERVRTHAHLQSTSDQVLQIYLTGQKRQHCGHHEITSYKTCLFAFTEGEGKLEIKNS